MKPSALAGPCAQSWYSRSNEVEVALVAETGTEVRYPAAEPDAVPNCACLTDEWTARNAGRTTLRYKTSPPRNCGERSQSVKVVLILRGVGQAGSREWAGLGGGGVGRLHKVVGWSGRSGRGVSCAAWRRGGGAATHGCSRGPDGDRQTRQS